jgi:hypothetical protein
MIEMIDCETLENQIMDNAILNMQQRMEQLIKENEALKKGQYMLSDVFCSVNDRGGVSVNGIGKYPIQLFPEQMIKFLDKKDMILKFIEDNKSILSWKTGN